MTHTILAIIQAGQVVVPEEKLLVSQATIARAMDMALAASGCDGDLCNFRWAKTEAGK